MFNWSALREHLSDEQAELHQGQSLRAAVLLCLIEQPEPAMLLLKRAEHVSQHPGEVAFPGGYREAQDVSWWHTALREAQEELGLKLEELDILGHMQALQTRREVAVLPVVAKMAAQRSLQVNSAEVDSYFYLPWRVLQQRPERIDCFRRRGQQQLWQIPAWQWQGYELWGFSAALSLRLLKLNGQSPASWQGVDKRYWPVV